MSAPVSEAAQQKRTYTSNGTNVEIEPAGVDVYLYATIIDQDEAPAAAGVSCELEDRGGSTPRYVHRRPSAAHDSDIQAPPKPLKFNGLETTHVLGTGQRLIVWYSTASDF